MLPLIATYFIISFCVLAGLSAMIFMIGKALADCPATGRAARAGALTIVSAFVAIGAGGILLVAGGAITVLPFLSLQGLMLALGTAVLCLGLGFTNAVAALRDVVARAVVQAAL